MPGSAWGRGHPISLPYAGRVIIPILDEDDITWLGWVGRTWYPSDKAYTYPKGMNRGNMLYNPRALRAPTMSGQRRLRPLVQYALGGAWNELLRAIADEANNLRTRIIVEAA